ncbi:hypothetical protein BGZ60DRAFT_512939 [Tricladium varicosporioides]|nr:hypothetical protein BGZ60DRAFT_512939 [Hymenoscyphus varicosporioides]
MAQPLSKILITANPGPSQKQFLGTLSTDAPKTVELFLSLLPYTQRLIHVRWSGEALWIPLGSDPSTTSQFLALPHENNTSHPAPGHFLLYPGGVSETEFLWAYGGCSFGSKMGQLAGNHFLSVDGTSEEGVSESLRELGVKALWEGNMGVRFEIATGELIEKFEEERRIKIKNMRSKL